MRPPAMKQNPSKIVNFMETEIPIAMTATTLKKQLHKAIDNIEDENFLQAVYTIVNNQRAEYEYDLSAKEWAEIESIQKLHKSGKSKNYTWDEVKKQAKSKLKK